MRNVGDQHLLYLRIEIFFLAFLAIFTIVYQHQDCTVTGDVHM